MFCLIAITFFTTAPTSPNTYQVVDAVVDALTSQAPCDRYVVGLKAWFFIVWMTRLPTVTADFIIKGLLNKIPAPLGSK